MRSSPILRKLYKSSYSCCFTSANHTKLLNTQIRYSVSDCAIKSLSFVPYKRFVRYFGVGSVAKNLDETRTPQLIVPLTKDHADQLILNLTSEERQLLQLALQEYDSIKVKQQYEDKLAGQRFRSKFGRPSKVPTLGDVDPTGTYCHIPDDWLQKKYAATVPKPSTNTLFKLAFANSIPFIGFGFLDNFIMIIAGDSIESSMSAYITLSTMAAAALGNTFSDVISIGSSLYVERGAAKLGLAPPPLSPLQLDMPVSRRFANMGRVIGITIGCFLGMTPLLFKDDEKKEKKDPSDTSTTSK